ncbi:hypothetical protein NVP1205O_65 [Vibrio phage 1.205.O._10N.222.51.A7]|nr:hypothetical protein NVP1205O_65 [Vibrio phage 1.205.O._10N.222.51.A7]
MLGNIHCDFSDMHSIDELREQIENGTITGVSSTGNHAVIHYNTSNAVQPKPKRTKKEFVKVNPNEEGGKYWECARDWSEGEPVVFHYLLNDSYFSIADNERLLNEYTNKNLYRRVEVEIDERQEFIDCFLSVRGEHFDINDTAFAGKLYDAGVYLMNEASK